MEFNLISQKLFEALNDVLRNDKHLLVHNINEPAISHRLAVYLETKFPQFNIDCEYNGNVDADDGRKYISLLKSQAKRLGKFKEDDENENYPRYKVFPDIVIHKRGLNGSENNLLVIEIKKSTNEDDGAWDAEKLVSFTSEGYGNRFNYKYGAFIKFIIGNEPNYSIDWYQNGCKTNNLNIP